MNNKVFHVIWIVSLSYQSIKPSLAQCASSVALKDFAGAAFIERNFQDLPAAVSRFPGEMKLFLARLYLLKQGYGEVEGTMHADSRKFIKKRGALEEDSAFFAEKGDLLEDYYRPTRHPDNPFLKPSKPNGMCDFAYTYQERRTRKQQFRDYLEGKEYNFPGDFGRYPYCYQDRRPNPLNYMPPGLLVGPNKEKKFIFTGYSFETRIGAIWNNRMSRSHGEMHKISPDGTGGPFTHDKKWVKKNQDQWFDYEDDCVMALAMDPDETIFYGGTKSGKVYRYSTFVLTLSPYLRPERGSKKELLPIPIEAPVDDIALSRDKRKLWILGSNKLYKFEFSLSLFFPVLTIPQSDSGEKMKVLRVSPHNSYSPPYDDYLLVGGDQGTVLLVSNAERECYPLEYMDTSIADMWWSKEDRVVLLSRSGRVKEFTLQIGQPKTCFDEIEK